MKSIKLRSLHFPKAATIATTLVKPPTTTRSVQFSSRSISNPEMPQKYMKTPEYHPITFDKNAKNYRPIVWIDCEMTGLDVFNDHIIEICCIVTDGDLNLIDPGYESVVHFDKSVMDKMNPWCIQHHGKSGLTQQVLASTKTTQEVEKELLKYIAKFTKKNRAVLAGNSVHMDRAFMMREFPKVLDHLHHRIIDVSSFFEFGIRFNPKLIKKSPKKKKAHTAKADILESIAELKWYQENFFVKPAQSQPLLQAADDKYTTKW